jgi:hypothetical protein
VLKGGADKDVGQVALVTHQTKSMVSVVWRDEVTGATEEKLKHPESLVQLESDLKMPRIAFCRISPTSWKHSWR